MDRNRVPGKCIKGEHGNESRERKRVNASRVGGGGQRETDE